MSASVITSTAIIVFNVVMALVVWFGVRADLNRERTRRIALERWLRMELTMIRDECGHVSPEALSVVQSLGRAMVNLTEIDIRDLRRDLMRRRNEYTAHVTAQTEHWCAVRAAVAAERSKGEPLPGLNTGYEASTQEGRL